MAQCWQYKRSVLWAITFSIIDLVVTTVIYGHGVDYRLHFLNDVYNFNLYTSLIELWVFGLARTVLSMGAALGFACRPPVAVPRMACIKPLVTALIVTMWIYTNVKLLLYSEVEFDLKQPWFWSLYAWTNLALLLAYITWAILSTRKVTEINTQESLTVVVNENIEDQEIQGLVNSEERPAGREDDKTESGDKETGDEEKKPQTSSLRTVGRLLKLSLPDWYILLTAFVFMTLSAAAEVFIPYYTGQVIQGIVIDKSMRTFVRAIIIMAVLSMASSVSAGLRGGCFKLSMARFQVRVCNLLFSTLMRQEVGFYDVTRTGEITSRLTSDTTTMCEALSLNTNIFLRSIIQAVGTIVFMVRLSWRLTMVSIIGVPLLLGVSEVYGEFYKNLSKKVQDSLAKVNEVAEEACSSIRTVRSFANERAEAGRYADRLKVTYGLKVKESLAYAGYMWCSDFFALALVVATLYYGGHLVILDRLSGGHLVSFILYQMSLGYCLETIASVYTGMMQAVGASEKVFEFLDREPTIIHEEGKLTPESLKGTLEFRNVSFSYPSRADTKVLHDISFTVSPGEVVALVGPSGGGKSTIVSLLEHFYETEAGQVLLDGVPIQDYDHKYLHTKIALVGQEPVLYARSIEENIGYGAEEVTPEQVENAAKQANAHDFISEMKEKYQTQTGEKGMQLSGGQKQRIAIARALIRNPVVLLLDEATSALDSESEYVVQEAIYNNLKGRTVIIVAHRLSTVERANRIIVIEKGKVVEQGTHIQLLRAGGMYSRLVKRQLLAFDGGPEVLPQPEADK